jgi:hypothetical protein
MVLVSWSAAVAYTDTGTPRHRDRLMHGLGHRHRHTNINTLVA